MGLVKHKKRKSNFESLEVRQYLSSVGWDGPGLGSAELTYYIGDGPSYLNQANVEQAIETALAAWSDVADIKFTQTSTPNLRDSIDFEFSRIDGSNGTLAQAYFPDDVNWARIAGDVEFDISETWEIGDSRGRAAFDITLVAVHEIGHSLGIDHLPNSSSVLNTSVSPNQSFNKLSQADVDAVLALYAPAAVPDTQTQQSDRLGSTLTETLADNATEDLEETDPDPLPEDIPNQNWIRWRSNRWNRGWNRFSHNESGSESNGSNVDESGTDLHEKWTTNFRLWGRFRYGHV